MSIVYTQTSLKSLFYNKNKTKKKSRPWDEDQNNIFSERYNVLEEESQNKEERKIV